MKTIFYLIFTAIFVACSNQTELTDVFSFNKNEQGLEVLENRKPVFFYQTEVKSFNGEYARNNYIHPLYGLDGETLTEDFPKDHPHHRGIFWAWHQIYVGDSSISDGWTLDNFDLTIKAVNTELMKNSARLKIDAEWKSPIFKNSEPYLRENTNITIHKLKDSLRIIDFEIKLIALVSGLRIGGSDNEKGYGGFSLRIKMPDDLIFTGDDGKVIPQKLQINAGPWIDFSGSFGENKKVSGITVLCHQSNPNYPQPLILRQKSSMQNIVFPGKDAIKFPKGEQLVLYYRMVLHNGRVVNSEIEKWQEEYNNIKY